MIQQADVAVLGGGPGGYVAALRAAQLGAQVVLAEEQAVGGVCLNAGCIPTKALLRSAEVYRTFAQAEQYGLRVEGRVTADWPAIQDRKRAIVRQFVQGVETLLRRSGVQVVRGRGRLSGPACLQVRSESAACQVEARQIIVATGSRPARLPVPGADLPGVLDSTGALELETIPRRMLVIGGGAVGVEFADLFNAFGTRVIVVEMLERLLPLTDAEVGGVLARSLEKRRIGIRLSSRVTRIERVEGGLRASVATPKGEESIEVDCVLVAVGRCPNVEDLGLESAGVRASRTGIVVDSRMRTQVAGIYAVGDATGGALLAHVAMRGGEVAAENALGRPAALDLKTVPWCVYTSPEVAGVGLTEANARERGYEVRVGRFPLGANGKALTHGPEGREGLIKLVSEARFGEVLGLHVVAPHASDLVHEGGLALALEATVDELIGTLHGHPTLGEAIREAALECRGGALHLPH